MEARARVKCPLLASRGDWAGCACCPCAWEGLLRAGSCGSGTGELFRKRSCTWVHRPVAFAVREQAADAVERSYSSGERSARPETRGSLRCDRACFRGGGVGEEKQQFERVRLPKGCRLTRSSACACACPRGFRAYTGWRRMWDASSMHICALISLPTHCRMHAGARHARLRAVLDAGKPRLPVLRLHRLLRWICSSASVHISTMRTLFIGRS